jgi:glycosyltransferase involved in cell wall biosynthesis
LFTLNQLVFIINSPYPNYSGGIENWLNNVSKRLSNEYSILIISNDNNSLPKYYKIEEDGVVIKKVKSLSSFSLIRPYVRSYINILDFFIFSITARIYLNKFLENVFSSRKSTTIICLDTMFCVFASLGAKKKYSEINLISSSRGPHAEIYSKSYPLLKRFFMTFEKRMLKKVHQIWANGYDTMSDLKKKGFNSTLMLNGVDISLIENTQPVKIDFFKFDKLPIIMNISTLLPIKGIHELIEAIEILICKENIKVNVVFIGKGDSKFYQNIVNQKGIQDYVYFVGHQNNPFSFAKNATILTCLSGGSGFSMAAIESMAIGVPVIAWDTPVYHQFNLNNVFLKLIPLKNSFGLAMTIKEILENYQKFSMISKKASNYAKSFDWSNVIFSFKNKIASGD